MPEDSVPCTSCGQPASPTVDVQPYCATCSERNRQAWSKLISNWPTKAGKLMTFQEIQQESKRAESSSPPRGTD